MPKSKRASTKLIEQDLTKKRKLGDENKFALNEAQSNYIDRTRNLYDKAPNTAAGYVGRKAPRTDEEWMKAYSTKDENEKRHEDFIWNCSVGLELQERGRKEFLASYSGRGMKKDEDGNLLIETKYIRMEKGEKEKKIIDEIEEEIRPPKKATRFCCGNMTMIKKGNAIVPQFNCRWCGEDYTELVHQCKKL
jgi:hypothetical protein